MYVNTNNLQWSNLHTGKCPKCSGELFNNNGYMKCSECTFKISLAKFSDSVKGKESTAYRTTVKRYKKIKTVKKKIVDRTKQAIDAQNKEREANLKRMKAKGLLTE